MTPRKFLIFRLKGEYGFFKKPETTTSPLSYYFPPMTTIFGIIGAICGFEKDSYHTDFRLAHENCIIAIKIDERIGSVFYNTNVAEFSNSLIKTRAPTNYTYLKKPSYLIYVSLNDAILLQELKERLESNNFVYNVSLGLANLLARVEYKGEKEFIIEEHNSEVPLKLNCVVPFKQGAKNFVKNITPSGELLKTNMPRIMNQKREVTEFVSYLYEKSGQPIELVPSDKLIIYAALDQTERIVGL